MSLLLLFQPQTAVVPLVPLVPGDVFHDGASTSANYTAIGANTTVGGNAGMFGTLGASGSIHVAYSGAAYVFEGVKKTLANPATIFQFWYRPASTATIGNGNSIFTAMVDSTYNTGTAPIRLDITLVSATTYKFSLIDPSSSFASAAGTTVLTLGVPVRIVLEQTSVGWKLYLNNTTTAEITYAKAQATLGLGYISFGTLSENAAGSYIGIGDFDEIWCRNPVTAPTTTAGKIADAYRGYLFNHLSADGQPYRGQVDGVNLAYAGGYIDTVSESAAYILKLTVQNNDQASFILVDNWILKNFLRVNSTTANTNNNAAPTNALNLMAFHYNSANTDGKGIGTIYDANWAGDADPERAQALLWAHSRFGSSALTVGVTGELVTPNYLQRALNVIADLRTYAFVNSTATGFNYLVNDSFQQGNATVQIGPDYNVPAAFKLFAQYDTANATFWTKAVSGAYDILNKSADVIFSTNAPAQTTSVGLNPNWISFTVATAVVGTGASTYGDNNYGYNAFRTYNRLYDMYNWYADAAALTPLRKPKSFFTSQYAGGSIKATYNHDGSNAATYEDGMFDFAAYWTLYAGDTGNTTASGLLSTKLSNTYTQFAGGGYFNTAIGGSSYAYFNQSWLVSNNMQVAGLWINYGQAAVVVVKSPFFVMF